jgi:hypothetical protein
MTKEEETLALVEILLALDALVRSGHLPRLHVVPESRDTILRVGDGIRISSVPSGAADRRCPSSLAMPATRR